MFAHIHASARIALRFNQSKGQGAQTQQLHSAHAPTAVTQQFMNH